MPIRPRCPVNLEDARRIVDEYVEYYGTTRLHSTIGYIAPKDTLEGREILIFAVRDRKLQEAREKRRINREDPKAAVKQNRKGGILQIN